MTDVGAGTAAWAAILLAAGVLELYGVRNPGKEDTLSEFTRRVFRVHTKAGRAVFATGWVAFAGWFLVHILS